MSVDLDLHYATLKAQASESIPVRVRNSGRDLLVARILVIDNGDSVPSTRYIVEMDWLEQVSAIKELR